MTDRRFFGFVAIHTFQAALVQIQLFIPAIHLPSILIAFFRSLAKRINYLLLVHVGTVEKMMN